MSDIFASYHSLHRGDEVELASFAAMSLFDVPEEVLDARPQGAKDFDFLQDVVK